MANNESKIWNRLMSAYQNVYGVAALMGNLYVESKLSPGYLESSKAKKMNITSTEYVKKIDNGEITREQFTKDGAGFGLAQWTYYTRKEALYDYAKKNKKSIGDLDTQLDFLVNEIKKYKTVETAILTATTVRACSDIIVRKYEKPANTSEKFLQNRADYGQKYLDKLIGFGSSKETKVEPKEKKYVVRATANVNLRSGNGLEYGRLGQLMKDSKLDYVAESTNGWYAVKFGNTVVWLSSEFSKKEEC